MLTSGGDLILPPPTHFSRGMSIFNNPKFADSIFVSQYFGYACLPVYAPIDDTTSLVGQRVFVVLVCSLIAKNKENALNYQVHPSTVTGWIPGRDEKREEAEWRVEVPSCVEVTGVFVCYV
eukprot:TRINITY_DN10784_c0_g1_i2.p1 TRINITY_DN10784_c0_g1~~TRINITY_DN10784_c0_g1_i2.p1  ORF type:complete len:121 (-),score=21.00 TRINITY_DN10784_c0_g1_i2:169-531(-)